MTERVTLDLPDEIAKQARKKANELGQPLEAVLTEWIKQAAADFIFPAPGVEYPIYTPFGNEAAAKILHDILKVAEAADKPET